MNKKVVIIVILVVALAIALCVMGFSWYKESIKPPKIEVTLKEDRTINFLEEAKVSDFLVSINGTLTDDYTLDTSSIGKKNISFEFINDENKKVNYSYDINVIDTVAPVIWLSSSYTVTVGNSVNLLEEIMCGDNVDDNPTCLIEGTYNINKVGDYKLTFVATDDSGNEARQNFTLTVRAKNTGSGNGTSSTARSSILFSDVVAEHKTDKTKIGIDISSWQGNVDFEKLKNAGVEFVMIRVGGTLGTNKEFFVDSKFVRNITEANKYNIPVGVYYYSYSMTKENAIKEAIWVLSQIKDYKIDLPVVFDWEDWADYNTYNLSFYHLTEMANAFLDTVKEAGYEGMLYSSRNYLQKIWMETPYPIWLAIYNDKTYYDGEYKMWQLCDTGRVDGVDGPVDIDVMYID
ncbi:MAG: hypothetical protein LBL91_00620 [Lachnospiraceae bacterium]|jgi:GH25 family lysozyme M1 (1,4-beta-N-acetylmuramidase)|nr:hypothetical protein [Lachnospiraceae bacterium]